MIYLFWNILNIGLLIVFIIICFRATKLIREKLGLIASFVFVFGLLSFMSNSGDRDDITEKEHQQAKKWVFTASAQTEPNTTVYSYTTIDKNFVMTTGLNVSFAQEKATKNLVAVEAYSNLSGSVSGYKWKPEIISVDRSSTSSLWTYRVTGSLKWKLLGTTVYVQNKMLTGNISAK